MIILNRCDLRSAEVNIATNSFNNFFSLSSYKRQDTKVDSGYTLLNKFSGKYGFTNTNYLNSGRSVPLQPKKQNGSKNIANITKNSRNVNTLSYLTPRTMVWFETRQLVNQSELRHTKMTKAGSSHFPKLVKKNINQVLRKVPLSRSRGRYMGQTPYYVASRPPSIESLETRTIGTVSIIQYTEAPTIYAAIKTSTERTVLTRKTMSTKRLRKKIGMKSAIPLGVRFGSRNYVVTREVTKKENNNMLQKLLIPRTNHNLIKCPYGELKMTTKHEVISLMPSISIAAVDKSTSTIISTTESSPVEAIYMYSMSSETSTKKIFHGMSTVNKSEKIFPVTNMKLTSPEVVSMPASFVVETPILNTTERKGKKTIIHTANALDGWPIFSPYFDSRTDKYEIKLQEDEIKVQEDRAQADEKGLTNVRKDLIDYASIYNWSEDPFAIGGSQETGVEQ